MTLVKVKVFDIKYAGSVLVLFARLVVVFK